MWSTHDRIMVSVYDSHYTLSGPGSHTEKNTVIVTRTGGADGQWEGDRHFGCAALLGAVATPANEYVLLATTVKNVGQIAGHTVLKIESTRLLPIGRPRYSAVDPYVDLVIQHLDSSPLYFSRTLDITNSFERQAAADSTQPLWNRADDRFFWNSLACSRLVRHCEQYQPDTVAGLDRFLQPIVFGMLEIQPTTAFDRRLTYALVTRRSRHRAGTRYFTRGIDESGNVANFNETEQIVVMGPAGAVLDLSVSAGTSGAESQAAGPDKNDIQVLSYVQTRGSVPMFWAEISRVKYTPHLDVAPPTSALHAAKLHFEEQTRIYNQTYIVNLVKATGREEKVKRGYESVVGLLQSSSPTLPIHYIFFDFHNMTKGLDWGKTEILLGKLKESIIKNRFFHLAAPTTRSTGQGEKGVRVLSNQRAVIRTNCMDCLDRTNVVQSMFARFVLSLMLADVQVLADGQTIDADPAFSSLLKNVWADNADVVSIAYSGTGALKTDFTRTGERTKMGLCMDGVNSCSRYVKNNFLDGPRQDGFDLFLRDFGPVEDGPDPVDVLADHRPVIIRAVPYFFVASAVIAALSSISRRGPEATVWPVRVLMLVAVAVGVVCAYFIFLHGVLYVNWPKIRPPLWVEEHLNESFDRAFRHPVFGPLLRKQRLRRGRALTLRDSNDDGGAQHPLVDAYSRQRRTTGKDLHPYGQPSHKRGYSKTTKATV